MGYWVLKSKKGAAYLWVIVITMVVMILASVYIYIVAADARITNSYANGVRAYYLAESGAELALSQLYNQIKSQRALPVQTDCNTMLATIMTPTGDGSYKKINPFSTYSTQYTASHEYTVKIIAPTGSPNDYVIWSKGKYGTAERCVRVQLTIQDTGNEFQFLSDKWQWQQKPSQDFGKY
ncbi:MAG: hypothetical protein K6T65_13130 [Peptococcaceae bacterium]|nr:hypothetical protein [Peptococcaceae bacterium]